jgi:NarL family two-component system sensor histidine kinase LiaS
MLDNTVKRIQIPKILDVATYVSVAAMSLLGMSGLPSLRSKLMALGLVLVFVLLYRLVFRTEQYEKNPGLYFGAQITVLGLLFLLGSSNSDAFNFLFLMLCIHIAVVSPVRVAALWISLCYGIVSAITLVTRGTDGLYAVLYYSVTFIVCGFFGYVLQQAEAARDRNQRLVEELLTTQQKLQQLAVMEERNRLARDLHDSVKQQVFAISMQLSAARTALSENNKAYQSVIQAEKLAQRAGAELTTLIHQLRPPVLERKSLVEAIQEHVNEWTHQNNIETEINIGDVNVSLDIEQELFRVLQEALANVARHSRATKAWVALQSENEHVTLMVKDNGIGYDTELITKGVGLDSMKERLATVDGILEISSLPSQGTCVTARVRRS